MTRSLVIIFFLLLSVQIGWTQDDWVIIRARRYEPLILRAAKKHGIDPRLIWTVAYLESRFQHYDGEGRIITSRAGARGVMQFMPATALRYGLRDLDDRAQAIDAAARYLRDLQAIFAGRLDQVLAAYNAGEGAVIAFRDGRKLILESGKVINPRAVKSVIPPYRETINYVKNGVQIFRKLAAAGHLAGPGLPVIDTPEEQIIVVTVDLEEMPIELNKGSLYAVTADGKPSPNPNLPKNSKTQSIYSH